MSEAKVKLIKRKSYLKRPILASEALAGLISLAWTPNRLFSVIF